MCGKGMYRDMLGEKDEFAPTCGRLCCNFPTNRRPFYQSGRSNPAVGSHPMHTDRNPSNMDISISKGENTCKNGGECFDGINDFTCKCADGWEGKTCDESNYVLLNY